VSERLGLPPAQADRLFVRLRIDDALATINDVLRRRKATLHVAYPSHTAFVYLEMPGSPRQVVFSTKPGQRNATRWLVEDPSLNSLEYELREKLARIGAKLFLVIQTGKDQARWAKLQVFFDDSRTVAATLLECKRKTSTFDKEFTL
jgi:hypothetical protein